MPRVVQQVDEDPGVLYSTETGGRKRVQDRPGARREYDGRRQGSGAHVARDIRGDPEKTPDVLGGK